MTEIWQTAAMLESESGHRKVGLCTQNVLWSDANLFSGHSESGGNALMYAITEYALNLVKGRSFVTPVDLLDDILDEVHEYGKKITGHNGLRKKRKWWAFCLASAAAVLKKPSVIKRLFRAVFYRGEAPAHTEGLALLSSIAVSPDVQAKGIGLALVNAFIGEVKKRGGKGVFVTTDAEGNDKVNRFYQKLSFTLESLYNPRRPQNEPLYSDV